MADLLG